MLPEGNTTFSGCSAGLIQAVIFEVNDRDLIGYPTPTGYRYCCTKELVPKTKCFQDRLIYQVCLFDANACLVPVDEAAKCLYLYRLSHYPFHAVALRMTSCTTGLGRSMHALCVPARGTGTTQTMRSRILWALRGGTMLTWPMTHRGGPCCYAGEGERVAEGAGHLL